MSRGKAIVSAAFAHVRTRSVNGTFEHFLIDAVESFDWCHACTDTPEAGPWAGLLEALQARLHHLSALSVWRWRWWSCYRTLSRQQWGRRAGRLSSRSTPRKSPEALSFLAQVHFRSMQWTRNQLSIMAYIAIWLFISIDIRSSGLKVNMKSKLTLFTILINQGSLVHDISKNSVWLYHNVVTLKWLFID